MSHREVDELELAAGGPVETQIAGRPAESGTLAGARRETAEILDEHRAAARRRGRDQLSLGEFRDGARAMIERLTVPRLKVENARMDLSGDQLAVADGVGRAVDVVACVIADGARLSDEDHGQNPDPIAQLARGEITGDEAKTRGVLR